MASAQADARCSQLSTSSRAAPRSGASGAPLALKPASTLDRTATTELALPSCDKSAK